MVVPLPIGQDVPVPPGLNVIADSQLISRTGNRYAGAIQHVSINHGRGHVSMLCLLFTFPLTSLVMLYFLYWHEYESEDKIEKDDGFRLEDVQGEPEQFIKTS